MATKAKTAETTQSFIDMKHIEDLLKKAREHYKSLSGEPAAFDTLCVAIQNLSAEPFRLSRKTMCETFKEDPEFENTYIASISMLLHDMFPQMPIDSCDTAAIAVMKRLFED